MSFDLHNHIPTHVTRNLLCDLSDMPDNESSKVNSKLRNIFEKYFHIKVLYKQKKIICILSNRKDIVILKQVKDRGLAIKDWNIYTEKCMSLLWSNQFVYISDYSTKLLESKVQWTPQKINSQVSKQECKKLYPTRSFPGKFDGTAKIHRLSVNGSIKDLPIPIVWNLNIATYKLAKYLSKKLSSLRQSEDTAKKAK